MFPSALDVPIDGVVRASVAGMPIGAGAPESAGTSESPEGVSVVHAANAQRHETESPRQPSVEAIVMANFRSHDADVGGGRRFFSARNGADSSSGRALPDGRDGYERGANGYELSRLDRDLPPFATKRWAMGPAHLRFDDANPKNGVTDVETGRLERDRSSGGRLPLRERDG
jgi:hypothetical protein